MALVVFHEQRSASLCQCGSVPPLCAYCIWGKLGPKWQADLRDCHTKNGEPFCCPIISDIIDGKFAVGCSVCRDAGSTCNFGQFKVNTPKYVQLISFRRHIETKSHIAVCGMLGIEVITSAKCAQKFQLAANAPPSNLFLWGLTTTFTNSSYRSFRKFHQSSEVSITFFLFLFQKKVRFNYLWHNIPVRQGASWIATSHWCHSRKVIRSQICSQSTCAHASKLLVRWHL
jgi:hypothetical protein